MQLPGISSDEAVERLAVRRSFSSWRWRSPDGQAILRNPDGTTTTRSFDEVLQSGALIQQAEFIPIVVTDEDGVRRELNGSYLDRGDIFITRNQVGLPILNFGMNDEGANLLEQATTRLLGRRWPSSSTVSRSGTGTTSSWRRGQRHQRPGDDHWPGRLDGGQPRDAAAHRRLPGAADESSSRKTSTPRWATRRSSTPCRPASSPSSSSWRS